MHQNVWKTLSNALRKLNFDSQNFESQKYEAAATVPANWRVTASAFRALRDVLPGAVPIPGAESWAQVHELDADWVFGVLPDPPAQSK